MKYEKDQIENALEHLTKLLSPGDTVYTDVKHVSASGMSRHIAVYVARDSEIKDITYFVGVLLGERRDSKTGGLRVSGCGMDMGFHTVYNLSRTLFPNGFYCSGSTCASNQHFNDENCRRDTFFGQLHTGDSGYALNQRWI